MHILNLTFFQKEIDLTKELTYFNNPVSHTRIKEYDLFFAYTKVFPLYDQRKTRDNRQYLPDIRENIFQQVCIGYSCRLLFYFRVIIGMREFIPKILMKIDPVSVMQSIHTKTKSLSMPMYLSPDLAPKLSIQRH